MTDSDPQVRTAAALAWCTWEDTHVSLDPTVKPWLAQQDPQFRELFALHVAHSWAHDAFLGERGILDEIAAIAHLPAVLIHGRLDVSASLGIGPPECGAGRIVDRERERAQPDQGTRHRRRKSLGARGPGADAVSGGVGG